MQWRNQRRSNRLTTIYTTERQTWSGPKWKEKYFEGHVGRVYHTEDGNEEVWENASAEGDDCHEEEWDDEVGWAKVAGVGRANHGLEIFEVFVDRIKERIEELFDWLEDLHSLLSTIIIKLKYYQPCPAFNPSAFLCKNKFRDDEKSVQRNSGK